MLLLTHCLCPRRTNKCSLMIKISIDYKGILKPSHHKSQSQEFFDHFHKLVISSKFIETVTFKCRVSSFYSFFLIFVFMRVEVFLSFLSKTVKTFAHLRDNESLDEEFGKHLIRIICHNLFHIWKCFVPQFNNFSCDQYVCVSCFKFLQIFFYQIKTFFNVPCGKDNVLNSFSFIYCSDS